MQHAQGGELMAGMEPPQDCEQSLRSLVVEELDRLAGLGWLGVGAVNLCFRHNPRLRTALGRFLPEISCIEVNPRAWQVLPPEGMRELLVHEIAHAVVVSSRPSAKPHGVEWKALMAQAGFSPNPRLSRSCITVPSGDRPAVPRRSVLMEHRCPVCHSVRFARRRVTLWRCAACVAAGLDGRFLVTPAPTGAQ